jgi:hypothetical protein
VTGPKRRVTAEDQMIALDRGLRLGLLGFTPKIDRKDLARRIRERGKVRPYELDFIADLVEGKKRKRHRPKSAEAALKADSIAQGLFLTEALHPDWKREAAVATVMKLHSIKSRSHVFEVLKKIDPEREKSMKALAAVIAEHQRSLGPVK